MYTNISLIYIVSNSAGICISIAWRACILDFNFKPRTSSCLLTFMYQFENDLFWLCRFIECEEEEKNQLCPDEK